MFKRENSDIYFMQMAKLVSTRSTCLRRQVGAVIVKDNRILCSGYNGVPSKVRHCDEVGCLRDQMGIPSGERHELCRGIHAEQNAVIQAATSGIDITGADIYCTHKPCIICAKIIAGSKLKRVIIDDDYPDKLTMDLLSETGIDLVFLEKGE